MAYISQNDKKNLTPKINEILQKYNLKGSLRLSGHCTLILTIKSGPIDFIGNYNEMLKIRNPQKIQYVKDSMSINKYWYHEHFSGAAKECLKEIIDAMNVGNHDNSDIMSDYHDVGWYIEINIGKWDKPYQLTA